MTRHPEKERFTRFAAAIEPSVVKIGTDLGATMRDADAVIERLWVTTKEVIDAVTDDMIIGAFQSLRANENPDVARDT